MIIADHLKRIRHRPRGIIHVGAHLGEERDAYLALRPERIVWVEADPVLAKQLADSIAAQPSDVPQIVVEALVTDVDDDVRPFYLFSNERLSSSVFHSTQIKRDHWPSVRETGESLTLRTSRLDTALAAAGVEPESIDVIVFDVQGAELLALRGAGRFLDHAHFIEVEVSQEEIYEGAPLVGEVKSFLDAHGFAQVTSTTPWHGDIVFRLHRSMPEG
jgi:FkbM family methyltransferase